MTALVEVAKAGTEAPVALENVGKDFRVRTAGRRWSLVGGDRGGRRTLCALDGVSFEVARGEIFGIVGPNGSGKSTLLKIVAGISQATRGSVRVSGRIGSLLEVGAGFHPELSGYENVYLNGSILGLSRGDIDRRMAEIVEFAGLEGFMHVPVKHYSSGMSVRLGFSIAAFTEPDVLLLDETFSVGDAAFQARALHSVLARRDAGAAILLVSHDLLAVREHCTRALWLHEGRSRALGPADEVVDAYTAMAYSMDHQAFASTRPEERAAVAATEADAPIEIVGVEVLGAVGEVVGAAKAEGSVGASRPAGPAPQGPPLPRLDHPTRLALAVRWRERMAPGSADLARARLTVTLLRRADELVVWRSEALLSDLLAGSGPLVSDIRANPPSSSTDLPRAGTVRLSFDVPRFYTDRFRFVVTLAATGSPTPADATGSTGARTRAAASGRFWSRAVADFELDGLEQIVPGPYPFLADPCEAIEHRPTK
jgi:ABC-type polysaccharide/polyol phosphate transport system ATPase subunit